MTVRGGIADMLESIGDGRMLLAYSGGLHHVQVPGERWPRLWKTIRMRLEVVDLGVYHRELLAQAGPEGFKRAVIADLERRRDENCPPPENGRQRTRLARDHVRGSIVRVFRLPSLVRDRLDRFPNLFRRAGDFGLDFDGVTSG